MKNEVLARAISGIDDDLIAAAHNASAHRKQGWLRIAATAACLAVVCTALLLFAPKNEAVLRLNGTRLNATPNAIATAEAPRTAQDALVLTLEATLPKQAQLTASEGELTVNDARISAAVSGKVTLQWHISAPNTAQAYTLCMQEQGAENTVVFLLFYDKAAEQWMIKQQ